MTKTSKLETVLPILAFTSAEIAAAEDFTAGDPASKVIRLSNHGRIMFVIGKLAGAAMTVTPTVESCDDTTPTNTTAIPYRYRTTSADGVTYGNVAQATASGVLLAAGANELMVIEVDANQLVDRSYVRDQFVRLQLTETDSTAQDGFALAILLDPLYEGRQPGNIFS